MSVVSLFLVSLHVSLYCLSVFLFCVCFPGCQSSCLSVGRSVSSYCQSFLFYLSVCPCYSLCLFLPVSFSICLFSLLSVCFHVTGSIHRSFSHSGCLALSTATFCLSFCLGCLSLFLCPFFFRLCLTFFLFLSVFLSDPL